MLRPGRDHPIVNFIGPAGSAKTTAMEVVASLVDPREPAHTGMPRNPDDLMLAAAARSVLCVDNVSKINGEMADSLCRLATGAGSERRELYTSGEVFISRACCPVMMTSLETVSSRDDFQRRTINLHILPATTAGCLPREMIKSLAREFAPAILGNLLDAVACAIRDREKVAKRLAGSLPALADMAIWVEAGAPMLRLKPGEFLTAYRLHKQRGIADAADSDEFVRALVRWLVGLPGRAFQGSARAILEGLARQANGEASWLPGAAKYVGERLDAKAAMLAAAGIEYHKRTDAKNHSSVFVLSLAGERGATDKGQASTVDEEELAF